MTIIHFMFCNWNVLQCKPFSKIPFVGWSQTIGRHNPVPSLTLIMLSILWLLLIIMNIQ